jgi:zinc transport system substrate-binding protein
LFLTLLLWFCFSNALAAVGQAGRLQVFVSILPQKHFVEQIGGEHVQVTVLVGPGQSPATFEPHPRQMAALTKARLYYRMGVPFEEAWIDRIVEVNPSMAVLDARDGITLRSMEQAGGGGGHVSHGRLDPHIWLDPLRVKSMLAHLREQLSQLDPGHQAEFEGNYRRFAAELDTLDREIRHRLSALTARSIMVFHPSWGYFTDRYGLRQVPIEIEGKEPGGRSLARLVDKARAEGISVIFVQPQFSRGRAQVVAEAVGARLLVIDPLAEDYPANLRRVADAIAESGG